jgi:phosphoserine phosphatase RsbX
VLLEGRTPRLDWAAAGRPIDGEDECGDALFVDAFEGGVLVGLVDGLGHGPEAAAAARAAIEVLAQAPADSVEMLLGRCHLALGRTRGAAVSLLSFCGETLSWAGVGNVEAVLLPGGADDAGVDEPRALQHLLLVGGIVGQMLPRLLGRSVQLRVGDLLVAASDGVRPGFGSRIDRNASPLESVERLLAQSGVGDDVLIWVGRVRESRP